MKNIFIDCEMTGLHENGELISLGALYIDDNGIERSFYAEFNDFSMANCNSWVVTNVINKLKFRGIDFKNQISTLPGSMEPKSIEMKGDKEAIRKKFAEWISNIGERAIMVADVGHYDISMVYNIFGGAFELPKNLSPAYMDLNNLIAIAKSLNVDQAFDISREKLAGEVNCDDKHNALYDARVARAIYFDIMKSN